MSDPLTTIAGAEVPNLAVDVLPDVEVGTFQLDVSELDGFDLLGWGEGGWQNIVCDVMQLHAVRGATRLQGALTRTEAGSVAMSLLDTERRFDPLVNADAIHPGSRVRVRAWGEATDELPSWSTPLFTGRIGSEFEVRYAQTGASTVSFTVVDVVSPLALFESIGQADPGVGAGDTLLTRTQRVVAEVGLPSSTVSTDADPAYATTLASSPLAKGWDDITRAVDAELGRVWVDANDQLVVRGRGSELTGPIRGTLSDWHGETVTDEPDDVHCCYTDPVVRFGTDSMVNRAIGGRRVPSPADGTTPAPSLLAQVDDEYSQERWTNGAPVAHTDTGLELEFDAQVRAWAEYLVLASADPELRVDAVTVTPATAAAWRAACLTDIGDRWAFRLHPEVGDAVRRTLGVLGIAHEITPEGWTVTFVTVDAPEVGEGDGWFVLDVSELDGEAILPPQPVYLERTDDGDETIYDGGGPGEW